VNVNIRQILVFQGNIIIIFYFFAFFFSLIVLITIFDISNNDVSICEERVEFEMPYSKLCTFIFCLVRLTKLDPLQR